MVMWTKRHFEALAKAVREATNLPWTARREWAHTLADLFGEDNPNFDRFRFLEAAGVQYPPCVSCGEPNNDHLPGCALQESFMAHPAQGVTT